ncbi:MAG TPA: nickel-dependent lactate racemase, partial [Desulfatiglandales bacterium]
MKIDLLYGRRGLTVELPEGVRAHVIRKHPMPLLPDPAGAVRRALERPVACPSLQELAQGKRNACILICDITRPVPNGLILPPLIESLTQAGIARENILILVATGLHRPNEGEELAEIIGSPEIQRTVRIENHFARDREAHVDLGRTSTGIPIMIDRRFVEADLKIVTGLVEPHFMAGYSGGRKVIAPGVAYQDTILMFHMARILEHCKAANCIIEGNPLHNEQTEIVRAIGGVVAVNVVIDEERRLGFVNFGEVEASHARAVEFMRKYAEIKIPRRFKTIVTTSAGHPLDKTYYQTVKGMVGVMDILEPGGTIIIASECSEGMGSREFAEAQRLLCQVGPERFMSMLEGRDKALIDEWETEMLLKPLRVGNIQLYSTGLSDSDRKHVFVETIPSVEEAVAASIRAHGDAEIAVVPEGPYVIPLYGG